MAWPTDIAVDEAAPLQGGAGALDLRRDARRHDGDLGARFLQQAELAQRQLAAAYDQGGTVLQIEKDRKILHRIRSIALPLCTEGSLKTGQERWLETLLTRKNSGPRSNSPWRFSEG